jgi:hypothetical protein
VKRAFKVATAFTGMATCATVMAPAADGATMAPLTAMNCTEAQAPWVHLYYSTDQDHPTPACFGNNGYNYITKGQKFSYMCTGNNYGAFTVDGTIENFTSN